MAEQRDRAQQALGVRVRRGGEQIDSTSVFSTARPAYITCTRSATRAITPRSWVIMHDGHAHLLSQPVDHLEDLRLHRDVERRRRLVGDQHLRVVGDRHRDHHALAHAARELVRILVGAVLRLRDADRAEQVDRRRCGRLLRHVLVRRGSSRRSGRRPDGPDSAPTADPGRSSRPACPRTDRIVLVDAPTSSTPFTLAEPVICADLGSSPSMPEERDRLARPALADHTEDLAGVQIEIDPANRLHHPVGCVELDTQIAQRQHRLSLIAHLPASIFGSKASRRPSPMKLMQIASSTSAPHGNTTSHQLPCVAPPRDSRTRLPERRRARARLRAEPEEGERRLGDDGCDDRQRERHQDRPDRVRNAGAT